MDSSPHSRCAACSAPLWVDSQKTYGEMVCPRCLAELWFVNTAKGTKVFIRNSERRVDQLMRSSCDGMDSLEIVELVMEIEGADKN